MRVIRPQVGQGDHQGHYAYIRMYACAGACVWPCEGRGRGGVWVGQGQGQGGTQGQGGGDVGVRPWVGVRAWAQPTGAVVRLY